MSGIDVRLAADTDGPAIVDLMRRSGTLPAEVEMQDIAPFWLVAERDNQIQACCQIMLGRPFGSVEMVSVDPDLSPHVRGKLFKALVWAALATAKKFGVQIVRSVVEFENKPLKRALKRHVGAEVTGGGTVMIRRL